MGNQVLAGEAKDDAAEERHQQPIVDDGIGDDGTELKQSECAQETAKAKTETQPAGTGEDFVDSCQHDAEDEASQMGQRRVFEHLKPGRGTPAVGYGEVIGVE